MEGVMIKKIKVVNSYGEELVMTLSEPQESGYAITNVSGLEPTQVDVKQTQMVSGLRYKYNFGFHKFREISMQIVYFEWNDLLMDVKTLRDRLYRYFKTNDLVTLYFERDYEQYAIQGYVSRHDSVVWSSNCGATITVTCPDPWFRKRRIDFQDEDESTSVLGIESQMYVNSVNISYNGNIGNGFVLETETDVRNFAGEELVLESFRESISTGKLILNVPSNYPDINITIDSLGISLIKDSLAVYTGHIGELCHFLVGTDAFQPSEDPVNFYCYINNSEDVSTIGLKVRGLGTCSSDHGDIGTVGIIYTTEDLSNISNISFPIYNTSASLINNLQCNIIKTKDENSNIIYTFRIINYEEINGSFYMQDDSSTYAQFDTGYIISDKNAIDAGTPNNYGTQSEPMDHIGWVDATSISKRTPLPRLEPGYNTIKLNTSSGLPVKFKIKYNTLYRGL